MNNLLLSQTHQVSGGEKWFTQEQEIYLSTLTAAGIPSIILPPMLAAISMNQNGVAAKSLIHLFTVAASAAGIVAGNFLFQIPVKPLNLTTTVDPVMGPLNQNQTVV